jgi:dynein light intermediate chain, axonemal
MSIAAMHYVILQRPLSGAPQQQQASSAKSQASAPLQPLLRAMLPNHVWRDERGEWVQTISAADQSRPELALMAGKLDGQLKALQARQQPVCSARTFLFSDAFDEMVRQVTIECPVRGLLLLRVRDQMRMSLEIYVELHRDGSEFSALKAETAAQELAALTTEQQQLQATATALKMQAKMLELRQSSIEKSHKTIQELADKARKEQLKTLLAEQSALKSRIQKTEQGGGLRRKDSGAPIVSEALPSGA